MAGSTTQVTTADGVVDAYVARPGGSAATAGVLFIMDAYGLRPRIAEMIERIASHGYVVLAPNVFYRAGPAPVAPMPDPADPDGRSGFFERIRPLMAELTPDRLAEDGAAYLDYLATLVPGGVGITGYCMGARVGWRIATAHSDRVAALGGFHGGGLVTDAPDSPHRSAAQLSSSELYLGHADQDPSMTAEQIEALDSALTEAGVRFRSEVYEGAQHGYTMSDTPAYDEAACERHFRELFALLERTVAPVA